MIAITGSTQDPVIILGLAALLLFVFLVAVAPNKRHSNKEKIRALRTLLEDD